MSACFREEVVRWGSLHHPPVCRVRPIEVWSGLVPHFLVFEIDSLGLLEVKCFKRLPLKWRRYYS